MLNRLSLAVNSHRVPPSQVIRIFIPLWWWLYIWYINPCVGQSINKLTLPTGLVNDIVSGVLAEKDRQWFIVSVDQWLGLRDANTSINLLVFIIIGDDRLVSIVRLIGEGMVLVIDLIDECWFNDVIKMRLLALGLRSLVVENLWIVLF